MSIRNLFKYVRTKDENLNKALQSAKDQFDTITRAVNVGTEPAAHLLVGAKHTASGLTIGHFLKASGPAAFGFAAHGLIHTDVGAAPASHNHAGPDINSGTIDGDRLPDLSATKKGGAPATGTPSGKYLKDSGTWDTPAGTGVPPSRLISTNSPLAGGGDLSADRTLSIGYDSNDLEVSAGNLRFVNPVNVKRYVSFAAAVTAIGSTPTSLYIPDAQSVGADVTVPSTIELYFGPGGSLSIATGYTVTINGPIIATLHKIFTLTGTGKATVANRLVEKVFPQWWGALGDGSNDDTSAIQAALDALEGRGIVFLTRGTYLISAPILVPNGTRLMGVTEGNGSMIKIKNSTSLTSAIRPAVIDGTQEYYYLEHLQIDGNYAGGATFTEGVIYAGAVFNNSRISDVVVHHYAGAPGILVDPGTAGDGAGSILFHNVWLIPHEGGAAGIRITSKRGSYEAPIMCLTFDTVFIEECAGYHAIEIETDTDYYARDLWFRNFMIYCTGIVPIKLHGACHSKFENFHIWTDHAHGFEIDNASGKHSYGNIFINIVDYSSTPVTNMIIDSMTGYSTPGAHVDFYVQGNISGKDDYFGKLSVGAFRINQTPTVGAPTPDAYITISCNGVDYKIPVKAV